MTSPSDVYYKIQYAQNIFKRGIAVAFIVGIVSLLSFIYLNFIPLAGSFLFVLGSSFAIISFIQHYRGYRICQRMKRRGRITPEDMADIQKIKWF
jgi:CHASE2 domain-containing sensor protein